MCTCDVNTQQSSEQVTVNRGEKTAGSGVSVTGRTSVNCRCHSGDSLDDGVVPQLNSACDIAYTSCSTVYSFISLDRVDSRGPTSASDSFIRFWRYVNLYVCMYVCRSRRLPVTTIGSPVPFRSN